jgi:hypothetical protein
MYVRRNAFWNVCRDFAKMEDEAGETGFGWTGLKGELWMNRAVVLDLGS